ncbi:hypothetical protein ANTPLA_LOCUS6772 [Anthophora plagiata]
MQAVEMMRSTRAIYKLAFLIFLSNPYVHSFPLQILPSIPGYIPVYIRHGDQPLEEINPALAEAFHEGSSLSKNRNLDSITDLSDINPAEDEENKYNVYPVHVREANNPFTHNSEESKKAIEKDVETQASESVTNVDQKNRREKHRRKLIPKSVVKVNLPTEEEKEILENLQIAVEGERKDSNDKHDASLHLYDTPSHKSHYKSNERYFNPVTKVDQVITDESVPPVSHLIKDFSQLSNNEDLLSSPLTNEELPIKEQPLPNVLSNVQKLFVPSGTLIKPEKERMENQSLEKK